VERSQAKTSNTPSPDLELALERWADDGGATTPAPPVPDEIATVVEAWWWAWATKNMAAIDELVDDEYSEFSDLRKWQCVGKKALLAAAEKAFKESTIDSWHIRDLVVRHGLSHDDIVICEYFFSSSGKLGGGAFRSEGFATDVLVQRDGHWKYFSHHNSLIKERSDKTRGPDERPVHSK